MNQPLKSSQPPLIAIVDDDDSLRNSARMLVNSFGYRAEVFSSPKELLHWPLLGETACLILDVFIPEMNGLELQRLLRRTHPLIPIIFITAHAKEDEERQAMSAGAVAMLRKPVADGILLNVLRQVFDSAASQS